MHTPQSIILQTPGNHRQGKIPKILKSGES